MHVFISEFTTLWTFYELQGCLLGKLIYGTKYENPWNLIMFKRWTKTQFYTCDIQCHNICIFGAIIHKKVLCTEKTYNNLLDKLNFLNGRVLILQVDV